VLLFNRFFHELVPTLIFAVEFSTPLPPLGFHFSRPPFPRITFFLTMKFLPVLPLDLKLPVFSVPFSVVSVEIFLPQVKVFSFLFVLEV